MAAKTEYRVKAAMIVVKVAGAQGGERYLHHGAKIPVTVDVKEVKRLLDLGLIEKVTVEDKPTETADTDATGKG